ncbi:MAG TPA: extensin family protein [Kofleriaceae bacterium]|jgi:hypothetical protein
MRLVILAVLLVAGVGEAAPKKHHAPAHRADNMPRGFAWPPSPQMREMAAACEAELRAGGVAFSAAKAEGHMVDAITLGGPLLGGVTYAQAWGSKAAQPMDCQLAAALVEAGPALAALGVREVRFGSIYRWSNIRVGGVTKPILSRHALGLAMDVVSFVLADGTEAVVGRDYRASAVLHAIERAIDGDARFRTVLTPANDPISHEDHFHLEANPDYSRPPS